MLCADIIILHLPGNLLAFFHSLGQRTGSIGSGGVHIAGNFGKIFQLTLQSELNGGSTHTHFLHQCGNDSIFLVHQGGKQMPYIDFLLTVPFRYFSHLLNCCNTKFCESIGVYIHDGLSLQDAYRIFSGKSIYY